MNTYNYMGLQLIGWVREHSKDDEKEPILYRVSGLSPEDTCIVGYAGMDQGKKKWFHHWWRSGKQIPTPNVTYDSPQDALKAIAEIKEKGM